MTTKKNSIKNGWTLLILVLAGVLLGSFISHISNGVSFLKWLDFGKSFGLTSPLVLDLGILVLTFGLTVRITIGSLVGIALAVIIYKLI